MSRKLRLSIFAVVITLGVFVLVKTIHHPNDIINAPEINIKPSDPVGSIKIDDIKPEAKPEKPKPTILQPVTDKTEVDGKAKAKDLTEKPGMEFNPEKEYNEIISFAPVVMFSKTYCPYSQRLKALLKNDYELIPVIVIVELDKHKHGKELQQYIGDQTGRRTVPNLFVKGVSRGGFDDMKALHDKGELLDSLTSWGGKSLQVTKHSVPSNSK